MRFFYFSVSKARIIGDKDVLVQTGSDINLTCRAEQVIKDEQVMILDLCTLKCTFLLNLGFKILFKFFVEES